MTALTVLKGTYGGDERRNEIAHPGEAGAAVQEGGDGGLVLLFDGLDKLTGALARNSVDAKEGLVLLTSRVSVEMVQKTAVTGATVMVNANGYPWLAASDCWIGRLKAARQLPSWYVTPG